MVTYILGEGEQRGQTTFHHKTNINHVVYCMYICGCWLWCSVVSLPRHQEQSSRYP